MEMLRIKEKDIIVDRSELLYRVDFSNGGLEKDFEIAGGNWVAENGGVTGREVITAICKKLIGRHTHIFGKDKATNEKEALAFWEKAKATEKGQKDVCDKLDCVPKTFTALQRAGKVQKIIKKTGFDFPNITDAVNKIYEETKSDKQ